MNKNFVPDYPCRSIRCIDSLMQTADICPQCGADNDAFVPMRSVQEPVRFAVACFLCDYLGPAAQDLIEAVNLWNGDIS